MIGEPNEARKLVQRRLGLRTHLPATGSATQKVTVRTSRSQSPTPSKASNPSHTGSSSDSEEVDGAAAHAPATLHEGSIGSKTLARYTKALVFFQTFWRARWTDWQLDKAVEITSTEHRDLVDLRCGTYLEDLYKRKMSKSRGADTVCALQYFWPSLNGHLKRSWRLIKNWNWAVPNRYRAPWPVHLVLAMMAIGFSCDRPDVALCIGDV